MADQLIPDITPVLDANGDPVSGGTIQYFQTGTTTPVAIYSDSGATSPLANPLTLDGGGRTPSQVFYVGATGVKAVIRDSEGAIVRIIDPIPRSSISDAAASGITFTPIVSNPATNVQAAIANNRTALNQISTENQTVAGSWTFNGNTVRFDVDTIAQSTTYEAGAVNARGWGIGLFATHGYLNLEANNSAADAAPMIRIYRNTTTTFRVDANGNVTNTNNSYGAISDPRAKEDIVPTEADWLSLVMDAQVYDYTMKSTGQRQTGVITDRIRDQFPHLVIPGATPGDLDSFNYAGLIPVLLHALGQAGQRIKALEEAQ